MGVSNNLSATISLSHSTNVTDNQPVTISSQDSSVLTVSPTTCQLSTAHPSCTVTLTGANIGSTTINAAAPTYVTATSAVITVARYSALNYSAATQGSSTLLTGIRSITGASPNVYISGFYTVPSHPNVGLLYQGPLNGSGTWYEFSHPTAAGVTVTNTALYGPNNGNQAGFVQIVGSYTTHENGSGALGLIYQGLIANRTDAANWTTLTPPVSMYAAGDTVLNTIAHSTMGNYIVGNYDTTFKAGRAFICNTYGAAVSWLEITHPGALSLTAYGIWWNGGTSYTIAGGYSDVNANGIDQGYLVNWDSNSKQFSQWQSYNYHDQATTALISHFEGVTSDGNNGFYLPVDWSSADLTGTGAATAHIPRNIDGTLGAATWTDASYPGSSFTSANSMYLSNLIGVYQVNDPNVSYGFIANFPSA